MIRRRSDDDRRLRLLSGTDDLLNRIEVLRLNDLIRIPDHLRAQFATLATEIEPQARLRVPTTLAGAHDQVFRLQTMLLRAGAYRRRPRRMPTPSTNTASNTLPLLSMPRREKSESESEWLELVQLMVERARDRAGYLTAQAEAASGQTDTLGQTLAALRRAQAADAQSNFDDLSREAKRVAARPIPVDPPPTLPASGRFEMDDLVVHLNPHAVLQGGIPVQLGHVEISMLALLAANLGRVVTREAIQHLVTGADPSLDVRSRTVDVHMWRLRNKLGPR